MNRAELKARAKESLGGGIFQNGWLMGVVTILIVSAITSIAGVIPGIGALVALVIAGPLMFGKGFIFLKQSRDGQPINLADLFKGFSEDFGQTFLLGLMIYIFTFLWSLLFIIPGIIKGLSYSMAFYIKADHPEMQWNECINESKRMMVGHKGELFVLYLSFIGWMIVGSLAFGIGSLWVCAYMEATEAQFYNELVAAQ